MAKGIVLVSNVQDKKGTAHKYKNEVDESLFDNWTDLVKCGFIKIEKESKSKEEAEAKAKAEAKKTPAK